MAVNFAMLFAARVGTAIGEAGGSPPSHSLISDYFPEAQARHGVFDLRAGRADRHVARRRRRRLGQRSTSAGARRSILVGLPGRRCSRCSCASTVIEPPRGYADFGGARPPRRPRRRRYVRGAVVHVRARRRSVHLSLAAALHSVVWYAGGAFNNAFLQRSHAMTASQAGYWISHLRRRRRRRDVPRRLRRRPAEQRAGTIGAGTCGCRASRRCSCVPFQFVAYLSPICRVVLPAFGAMMFMAAVFFGPSFAMTQALATLRMRSVATSLLLFVQTLIGQGIGPSARRLHQRPARAVDAARDSLRYALVIVGLVNIWAALHYLMGARTLRQDLEATEKLATSCMDSA